jgi:TonB-linked SusC/RagA family outer membrane protein
MKINLTELPGSYVRLLKKFYLVMKLTWLLVLALCLQSAASVWSQTVSISLKSNNTTIQELFNVIESQSGYRFFYNNDEVDVSKTVSVNVSNKSIGEILTAAFKGLPYSFKELENKLIIIERVNKPVEITGQQKKVSGKVTDASGQALPGVTVSVKGTTNGTITDMEGNYSLVGVPENGVLVFSFVGMKPQEVSVAGKTTLDVSLQEETIGLEEVVAVGYGTQKKEALTGAITAVKGKELEKGKTANLSNSFAGRISGVVANTSTGEPGADGARLLIRGMSTTGDNSPLIVVDGVANRLGGLERIDANDIESVSVLKDASAAIYGAQAANGVILITTKKGAEGRPVFDFSYNQGVAQPTRLPDMADAATYARIANEINYYRNPSGGMNQIYSEEDIRKYADGSDPLNYPNTDWEKETLKNFSLQDRQAFSVRGGNKAITYFASLGRQHQDGLYKHGVLKYDQINMRSNVDFQLNEDLKVGMDIAYRKSDKDFPTNSQSTIFRAIYRTFPQIAAYYPGVGPSAGVESGLNPNVLVTDAPGTDKQEESVINALLNFEYKIPFAKDLVVKGFWALDHSYENQNKFSTPYIVYHY